MRLLHLPMAAIAIVAVAGAANAHPRLLSTNPAADATVMAPARIELVFSES